MGMLPAGPILQGQHHLSHYLRSWQGRKPGRSCQPGEVDSKASWAEHGRRIKGSNQTWLVAFGKDILHLGEMEGGRTIYTKQVAPTIASILKVPFTNDDNQQPEASPIYKILK